MQNVKYIGGSDHRTLSEQDMATLGIEDHPGLWFQKDEVIELEDEVAGALLKLRLHFAAVPSTEELQEEQVEAIVEDKTKEQLLEEAKALGMTGLSKLSKEELAEAVVAKQAELDVDSIEGDELEPHA